MPRPCKIRTAFAARLIEARLKRGMTQLMLADAIGTSQRRIAYYETECESPSADVLMAFAKTLRVSTDKLLGLDKMEDEPVCSTKARRYIYIAEQVADLPKPDRQAVLRMLKGFSRNNLASA